MILNGHGEQKYAPGNLLMTSAERRWSDILAERWQHKAGSLSCIKPLETEIAILFKGNLRVRRRAYDQVQDTMAVPGTVWFCPAGVSEEEIKIFDAIDDCIHLYIPSKPFSDTALYDFDVDPARIELQYTGGFRDEMVEQIGRAIKREMCAPSSVGDLLVETLRVTLAAHLLRHYSSLAPTKQTRTGRGSLNQIRLQRVIEFITANVTRNISLIELADEACLSPYHFARAFKISTGMTPHQFVMSKKLDLAKKLIASHNYSISEIAFRTGFSNQSHFIKAFKRTTGLTPGKYREKFI
ncbi:MAG: AraC family transcriptional regulator [Alphaproteobacteria bacterium]|nr:MAG: AraC family transcriptional regulator [Alphaproteobacteria bacterium]